ncbi:hypothetical protein DOTSEDRAFT_158568 [Dothistroma septosporum NZE10]|uniref:Uncharacterized protein n=1 Tax=Dothistroma septosporum (strain NZE10 / CBS 128990) TaxID=675120 RepID=N1PCZ8_DOTSN|nr:hypothetical protein DOTSEDRAFT_158568 [Dothistroma septosporum NZE10]
MTRRMEPRRVSSAMSAAGLDVNDLRSIMKLDIAASNELQSRIEQLRQDISAGRRPPEEKIALCDMANKDMTKDLIRRIEKIEGQGRLTTGDREMLQAFSSRLAVCDRQGMDITELRDWKRDVQRQEALPLGGKPRTPETLPCPPMKVTEHLRKGPDCGVRSTSPGPILERIDSGDRRPAESPRLGSDRTFGIPPSPRRSSQPYFPPPPSSPNRPGAFATPPSPKQSGRRVPQVMQPPPPPAPYVSSNTTTPSPHFGSQVPYGTPPSSRGSERAVPTPPVSRPRSQYGDARSSSESLAPRRSMDGRYGVDPPSAASSLRRPTYHPPTLEEPRCEVYYSSNYIEGDLELEKTTWPLLYRILDVDPSTPPRIFEQTMKRRVVPD